MSDMQVTEEQTVEELQAEQSMFVQTRAPSRATARP